MVKNLTYNHENGKIYRCFNGQIKEMGAKNNNGYIVLFIGGKDVYAHRFAWAYYYGELPTGFIDHINGDRADNRICNLRDVSHSQNMQNQRHPLSNNKTGFLGVSFHRSTNKYQAQIKAGGKRIHLGTFLIPEDAHKAYVTAKRELHAGCTI